MSKSHDSTARVRYRCRACRFEFTPQTPGVAQCPRCQSIAGHEPIATIPAGGACGGE